MNLKLQQSVAASSPEHNLVLKVCKELWLQPLCTALTSSGGDCILHLCSGEFAAASHGAGPIQSLRLEWDDQGIPQSLSSNLHPLEI